MAKFKVGDRVTDGDAVYEITDVDDGIYEWKVVSGKADRSYSAGGEITWADNKMRLANSAVRSTNAVVQNALNARTARNADGDGAAVKAIRDLQRRIAPLAREAEAMRGKFIANKWYGYDAALEFIAKRLKEAEAEGKW